MVPAVTATLGARYRVGATTVEIDGDWTAKQFLVGDESNDAPFRMLPASTIIDVRAEHVLGRATLFAEVSNVLDNEYDAFGVISENGRGPIEAVERFLTAGLPRRITAGVRVRLTGTAR